MVDSARRQVHVLGFRAWRVFLVWTRRNRTQVFEEIKRIELMPVKVSQLDDVSLDLDPSGLATRGSIHLSEISPVQVNELTLRGFINGALPRDDEEFVYEVRRIPRCASEETIPRQFTISTAPHFHPTKLMWTVGLTTFDAGGAIDPTYRPPVLGPKLAVLRR
jgi:hypothetical protein